MFFVCVCVGFEVLELSPALPSRVTLLNEAYDDAIGIIGI